MAVEPLLGTRPQRAFMITKALIVIALVASTFGIVHAHLGEIFDQGQYKTLPCYLGLFILAEIFELAMAYDALRMRNIIQLLGIILFHGALIVFSALQVHETRTAIYSCTLSQCDGDPNWLWNRVEPFLIIAPCIIAASWLFLIFWIKQLYGEFGWVIFRVVGANPKLKSMYQYYQILICLLKFDFFCFVGVTMQLLIVVLTANSAEFGITIAAIPVVVVLLVGCAYAVQREIRWLMSMSLVLMVASMSYFYKLDRFYDPSSQSQYLTTRATLSVFTIVAFSLLLASFVVGIKCFFDFDKGLYGSKTHDIIGDRAYLSPPQTSGGMAERQSSYFTSGVPLQPQISIE
ncbi:hypothetical protein PAXRUDRAFT_821704 [Paxillus rubicundulus Ve08.2h10]|uniref:Uncharacterized protein n=1 Tax=Paxillus rubicundulus Ve08.2h10 TaxID=930991 RepID=A0A0D0EAK7_9AGAM|nr:hypothetical protein PAXRUDRAFT_821704 [Paxillus rubicundulus Ve08.2h10]